MDCRHIEELLPGYAAGELTEGEISAVRKHIAGCELCGKSLSIYTELEAALACRRDEIPPPVTVADRVMVRLSFEKGLKRQIASWLVPLCWSAAAVAGAFAFFINRASVSRGLAWVGENLSGQLAALAGRFPEWIVHTAGGETWILITIYILLIGGAALTGGLVFIRLANR